MAEYIERTEELMLAMSAGASAIENTKRYHGAVYTKDVFSENSQEIPYLLAAKVLREVSDAPAADVAPVVHGRWDGDTCTACKLPWKYNMVQDADDWGYFDPMPDYCPNCGAKMDGGAENGRRRGNAHAQD